MAAAAHSTTISAPPRVTSGASIGALPLGGIVLWTPTIENALFLRRLDISVIPLPIGEKRPAVHKLDKCGKPLLDEKGNPLLITMPWKAATRVQLPLEGIPKVFAGRCNIAALAGKVSGNLFFIDCETPAALDYHLEQLKQRGISAPAVKSAKGGHIYLRAIGGEVENMPKSHFGDFEILGNNKYVLAPGSVHPSGLIYDWYTQQPENIPEIDIQRIDWLKDTAGKDVALKLKKPAFKRPPLDRGDFLSSKTREYLAAGEAIGNRNNRLFAAACDMAAVGYSQPETHALISQRARLDGTPQKEVDDSVKGAYSKPRQTAKQRSKYTPPHVKHALKAQTFAMSHPWTGYTADVDRRVFLALVERCRLGGYASAKIDGAFVFRASMRETAELAHVSRGCVSNAIERLKKQQLLVCVKRNRKTGNVYCFGKRVLNCVLDGQYNVPVLVYTTVHLKHTFDHLERGSIGVNGMIVYQAIVANPGMNRTELSAKTNLTDAQLRYILRPDRPLRADGLIELRKHRYYAQAATIAQLEQLAGKHKKAGKSQARSEKHVLERAVDLERTCIQWRKQHDPNYPIYQEQEKRKTA